MRALALPILLSAATPAFATGEFTCAKDKVSIDLLVGHVPFLSVARAVVEVGDKTFTTQPNLIPGTTITVAQAFEDDEHLRLDLADETMAEIIIRLRVFKGRDGDAEAAGGVLTVKGEGAFAVDCTVDE